MRGLRLFAVGMGLVASLSLSFLAEAQTTRSDRGMLAPEATERFLESRPGELVWSNDRDYDGLIGAIERLRDHGLNADHYHLAELLALRGDRTKRDAIATDAWFSAAAHMLYGKLDPVTVEPDWTAAGREADLPAHLGKALDAHTVGDSLEALAPRQPGYVRLLETYASLVARSGEKPSQVPGGPSLKSGMSGQRVTALQTRLMQLNLLPAAHEPGVMDAPTVEAVRTFQVGAGLDDDGVVGPVTVAALNRGADDYLNLLRVNMERWRWLPDELGRRHLRVNIAGFDVAVWQEGRIVRTHLTIVGRLYRKTPVFSDAVRYVVFNPWWETPPSLARIDKLPMFRKDPGAVRRLGFQVIDSKGEVLDPDGIDWTVLTPASFPYRLRQAPGPENALGQVKIMFPNRHNVYLHDTPSRGLFAHRQRAFSSGCVRTQDPLALVEWLLNETPGWSTAEIAEVVASGKERQVNLAQPVPVHILYFTAVVEPGGAVRYLDDIYDRDAAVLRGLKEAPKS